MAIIAKNSSEGGTFTPVPAGSYIARCYSVIDMGTHDSDYQGQKRDRHLVRITWEIPEETVERNGEKVPSSISKTYTLSLNEKAALRHDLESWRGKAFTDEEAKGFDVAKLLGAPCVLTIAEKDKQGGGKTSYISGVGKLGKGMICPPLVNQLVEYSVESGKNALYQSFPDWLKEKMGECKEWKNPPPTEPTTVAEQAPKPQEDDVPF